MDESRSALDRTLRTDAARDIARAAPGAYAELSRAVEAAQADRALTVDAQLVYAWALTEARVADARALQADAERRRTDAETDARRMDEDAARIDGEVRRLTAAENAAARAREAAVAPAAVPRAEREAAAEDMVQEGGLMVAAAGLLGATPDARRAVESRLTAATALVSAHGGDVNAALLAAGGAYTAAEALLRTTRTTVPAPAHPTDGTTLQHELSGIPGVDPHRDERGVVAVLHGLFVGTSLAPTARSRVETLARVIEGHADARVSLEVWVGGALRTAAEARARTEAQGLSVALVHAGVPAERIHTVGLYRAPEGPRRDDRVEVVLVLPTEP